MNTTDDRAPSYRPGYNTPPLSPTKTISTEGWISPRTPQSPRKTRSCLFIRDVDNGERCPFLTPPPSPTKSKRIPYCQLISNSDIHPTSYESSPPQSEAESPIQRSVYATRIADTASLCQYAPCAHGTQSLLPDHTDLFRGSTLGVANRSSIYNTPVDEPSPGGPRRGPYSWSESLLSELRPQSVFTSSPSETEISDDACSMTVSPPSTNLSCEKSPSRKLRPIPLRNASSPLRPSQWTGHEESLSLRSRASSPDRFIAQRRPPAVTRESFELSKPLERQEIERLAGIHTSPGTDVFGSRLRRSGRLNEELRGLREAHSLIIERSSANRRSRSFRRNCLPLSVRQISAGAVWNVGGPSAVSDTVVGVSTIRSGILGRGTNAPLYRSSFLNRADPEAVMEAYERRLALALNVDQADRVLQHSSISSCFYKKHRSGAASEAKHVWRDGAWTENGLDSLLDAPQLRDDYYCTLLAYSHTAKCLAVGLGNFVHIWSERSGVDTPGSLNSIPSGSSTEVLHVASLDFSSTQGGQAILAVGRADGRVSLWSPFDPEPRFDATQPKPVSSVCWRPTTVQRPSLRDRAMDVPTEELLIGDEVGHIYFYSIEWPSETQSALFGWHGAMTLLARLAIHTQQICGLAWSPDGELFASGGNDNNCFLFETKKILGSSRNSTESTSTTGDIREGPNGEAIYSVNNRSGPVIHLTDTSAKQKWTLNAAVKAMAFCPWQRGLLAIRGGSNDRCVHFYHTRSGTCLASIDCAAQVTSLIWSRTRREIAATFGFAQPDHPYRVAVFAWPSYEQVVAVPWWDESRALCAIAYPGGPSSSPETDEARDGGRARGEDGVWSRRGIEEGCIVVAASDMAIRFHEIWSDRRGGVGSGGLLGNEAAGLLGGSGILEGLHGLGRADAVIR